MQQKRVDWVEPVIVAAETAAGTGAFAVDDRLRADDVEMRCDGHVARALVSVRTDLAFTPADAAIRYSPDRRIVIRTGDAVLFDGYPCAAAMHWGRSADPAAEADRANDGRPVAADSDYRLRLEHVIGRLAKDERCHVVGRYGRDVRILAGLAVDPPRWQGHAAHFSGLPCIFNPIGLPNCDPTPLLVDDGFGGLRMIHVFSDDASADAVGWTFARALRYLLFFHLPRGGPVDAQSALAATDPWAAPGSTGRNAWRDSNPLAYALLAEPDSLDVEANTLLDAFARIAAAAGVHVCAESAACGDGVRTSLRIWSDRDGSNRTLNLASAERDASGAPVYDPSSVADVDLFAANNVSAISAEWNMSKAVAVHSVIGGVRRYEIITELKPGWLPQEGLDSVDPVLRDGAKSAALTQDAVIALGEAVEQDPWYRAYHRLGADFPANADVARRWILNEAGAYDGASYNRNAPFDNYKPFDFAPLFGDAWMRRRRRLLPVASGPGPSARVLVDVSFDAGQTWMPLSQGYQVLADEAGIWFDVDNPTSIAPPGRDAEINLWYALVEQTCRVRVTAMIESDQRLAARAVNRAAPILLPNAALQYAPQRYRFDLASDGSPAAGGRDDSAAIAFAACDAADARGAARIKAQPTIPWLDRSYAIGDHISEIRGRGVRFVAARSPTKRHAVVVGKRYLLTKGRWETHLILSSTVGESSLLGSEDR